MGADQSKSIVHLDAYYFLFDQPIQYRRPVISAFGHKIPPYEFYLNSDRGTVLMFKETMTAPTFEIYFPPLEQKK
jgi:hypothetical protein